MSKLPRFILYAGILALIGYCAVLAIKPDVRKAPSEEGVPVEAKGYRSLVDNGNAAGKFPPSTRERPGGTPRKRAPFEPRGGRSLVDNGDTEGRGWSLIDNGDTEGRGRSLVDNGDTEGIGSSLVDNGDTEG